MWSKILVALEEQQKKAGPRAAALLLVRSILQLCIYGTLISY